MNTSTTQIESTADGDEIARLQKELVETKARAELASQRLDKAEQRLEGAATLIGCLRSRIQNLELETDRLEWQCDKFEAQKREAEALNATLKIELEALRETYNRETDTLNNKLRKALAQIAELESSWWHQFKQWFLSPQRARI